MTDDWAKWICCLSYAKLFKRKDNIIFASCKAGLEKGLVNKISHNFLETCLRICFHITDMLFMYNAKTGAL